MVVTTRKPTDKKHAALIDILYRSVSESFNKRFVRWARIRKKRKRWNIDKQKALRPPSPDKEFKGGLLYFLNLDDDDDDALDFHQ